MGKDPQKQARGFSAMEQNLRIHVRGGGLDRRIAPIAFFDRQGVEGFLPTESLGPGQEERQTDEGGDGAVEAFNFEVDDLQDEK